MAGIMIVALDHRADPQRGDDVDEDGDENGGGHIGQRQQSTKRGSGMFLVIY